MRTKKILILAILLIAVFETRANAENPGDDRPNVVIVITDDQGYGDLSCHGNSVLRTPNLDQLHSVSTRLTDYHVAPTCSPTRAALLTGHWTNRTGVWHTIMGRSMLRENEVTVGKIFADQGYATGMFGKWHLGDNYPFRPEDRGFTEVLRHGGGGVGQTPDYWDNAYFDDTYWHNKVPVKCEGYCTDVFFDYAKRFISTQKESGKPFLAYISTNAPHGPMLCPEQWSAPYMEQGNHVGNFLGMIANIDDNVGRLREYLEAEGLAENTIFIFTTDNGTSSGHEIFNSAMRGKKGSEYDGGHRVPFFLHWPAGGYENGVDVDDLTAHVDVIPTLLELCELDSPAEIEFDGMSIRPLIDGEQEFFDRILVTDSQRVKDPIMWRKSAVMKGKWRLVNGSELYNVESDPGQKDNVAESNPEIVNELRQFYETWWEELEPTFDQDTLIYIGHDAENPARLTSHDWITTGSSPWNQGHIRRAANGRNVTGHWNVRVAEKGTYEVALRRWPEPADASIDAPLEPGADVPGGQPPRVVPGVAITPVRVVLQVGELVVEQEFEPAAKEVVFTLELEAQDTTLQGTFIEADGTEYGAYYAYVLRK
ncbi:MAG: arylsulfatase [Planctomycetota bacterium]